MPRIRTPRLLVADGPDGRAALEAVVGPRRVSVVSAHTLDDALAQVRSGVDAIACGITFDESRMFDLLRYVKADPAARAIPFVGFRHREDELPPAILESLDIACRALGGAGFLDLPQLRRTLPSGDAEVRIRQQVISLLGLPRT